MNKAELVGEVQKILGNDTSKAAAERAVDAVLEGIKAGLKKDSKKDEADQAVQLIGFGTFSVGSRAARKGINPRTKEEIDIPASKTVKFKPGSALKSAV